MPKKSTTSDSTKINEFLKSRVPAPPNAYRNIDRTNKIFVDKTYLTAQLAQEKRLCLFNRPSGFGMSVPLQCLENYFDRDKTFFKDLKGEAFLNAEEHKAPQQVVRLDFAYITAEVPFADTGNEGKDFARELTLYINNKCEQMDIYYDLDDLADYEKRRDDPWGLSDLFGLDDDDDGDDDIWGMLFGFSKVRYPKPATMLEVLIDELKPGTALIIENFDSALFECSGSAQALKDILECLREVLTEVEKRHKKGELGFTLITGRMPWDFLLETGSYADLSRDPKYARLLGFTAAEIKEYMGPELKLAAARHFGKDSAQVTADEIEELLELMAQHFGNYCFAPGISEGLYCPADLFDYFKCGLFKDSAQGKNSGFDYSYSSDRSECYKLLGTKGLRFALARLGQLQGLGSREAVLLDVTGDSAKVQDPQNGIDPRAILYASGYYSMPLNTPDGMVQYCLPNSYAADGLLQLIHDRYLPALNNKKDQRALLFQEIINCVQEGDVPQDKPDTPQSAD
ncbi:MAG: AAA family ATPase [Proteobacteria bacterium]|uniref:AAA family ATPase n=1 Tax=Candidatus Avisuccinivibrio stercorigallinarum TaxID=2840704 RepID=A0A9D9GQ06_9GAMM|nr:AAA family ATPase [Candidatus Avisuccinivibrio stercorigallinarum]